MAMAEKSTLSILTQMGLAIIPSVLFFSFFFSLEPSMLSDPRRI